MKCLFWHVLVWRIRFWHLLLSKSYINPRFWPKSPLIMWKSIYFIHKIHISYHIQQKKFIYIAEYPFIFFLWGMYNEIQVGMEFSPLSYLRNSRWRPRWPPWQGNPNNWHIFVTRGDRITNEMSIHTFLSMRNPFLTSVFVKMQYKSKITTKISPW